VREARVRTGRFMAAAIDDVQVEDCGGRAGFWAFEMENFSRNKRETMRLLGTVAFCRAEARGSCMRTCGTGLRLHDKP
jgi:hypothetical protein